MSYRGGAWIIKRRRPRGPFGLIPCPRCGRMNGKLQRSENLRCAIGVGCNRSSGHVIGRAE